MSKLLRTTLLVIGLAFVTSAVPIAPAPVHAVDLEDIAKARKMVEEAEPWFKQAANTDLDTNERKKGRQQAYKLLKAARNIYNEFLDANPSREEEFDKEYSHMAVMLHFIKKMSGIWEHTGRQEPEATTPEPPKPGPVKPETGPGDGGAEEGGKTEPGDGGGETGPSPKVDGPQELARKAYARLLAYQEAHPGDEPGLHDLCLKFLAEHEDPSFPEYEKVALLAGSLADKLNQFFKEQTHEDPDAIEKGDSKDLLKVINRLSTQLKKGETVEDRIRAARLLGETRSGAASWVLVGALSDKDAGMRAAARTGLVAIGGGRTSYNLTKKYRNASQDEAQQMALDILIEIARKSSVDAEATAVPIGRFVLSKKEKIAGDALDHLASLGAAGAPGLLEALETKVALKKVEIIETLGDSGYYPAAYKLATYLIKTDKPRPSQFKNAAKRALKKMGMCAIPHMAPQLGNPRCRLWTAQIMREIATANGIHEWAKTKEGAWRAWYRRHRDKSGCNGHDPAWVEK